MTFQDDNGNAIEVPGSFAMTKQAVSFFDFSIKGDVSINFQVDNNSANRKTLGYYGPQMNSQIAWTKQPFNRMIEGNVLDRGYLVIQDEYDEYLDCFYVSGNSNWVQLLQAQVTTLNFNDYNKLWNISNITTLYNATSGIIFPMVDFSFNLNKGKESTTTTSLFLEAADITGYTIFNFYPCFYISSLITEIFQQNGLKLAGNILTDSLYKSLVVTPSNGQLKRTPFKKVTAAGSAQSIFALSKYTSFTETADPDNLFANNAYTANKTTSIYVFLTESSTSNRFQVDLYKNGVFLETQIFDTQQNVSTRSSLTNCVSGDVFEIYAQNFSGANNITLDIRFENVENVGPLDYVNPQNFLPSLPGIDIVKAIFNFFGCVVYYDEFSKTLTANIIENISKDSSLDWSEYYISHRSEYTVNQAKNNYLQFTQSTVDSDVIKYNSQHNIDFCEGNIPTSNTLKNENTLVKLPIVPSSFGVSTNGIFNSKVPLINLVDEGDPIAFTAVTDMGSGIARFTVAVATPVATSQIFRISSGSVDYGYFYLTGMIAGSGNMDFRFYFTASFTGNIYPQKANYQDVGFRVLSVKSSSNIAEFSSLTSYKVYDGPSGGTLYTNAAFATFVKSRTNKTIDQWKSNLAFDNPDGEFTDPTMKERYFNKVGRFFQNPNIRAQMLIPASVFQSFDFSNFIYLRTEKLTGYFFVRSIVNYQDGNTPVEVNLLML